MDATVAAAETTTRGEPVRPLTDRDIPALFGVDSGGRKWRIWQELRGAIPATADDSLGEIARESWARRWIEGGFLGAAVTVRAPTRTVRHKQLPIEVRPDFVVEHAPQYGAKWGMGLLAPISGGDWAHGWHSPGRAPAPTEAYQLRMQTVLLATRARWGLIIPVVAGQTFEHPILVEPDLELQNSIAREITDVWTRVIQNDPPEPDGRADAAGLAALARHAAARDRTRAPTTAEREQLMQLNADLTAAEQDLAAERAALEPLRLRAGALRDELRQRLAAFGPVDVQGERLTIRVDKPKPRPVTDEIVRIVREPLGAETTGQQTGPTDAPTTLQTED